MDLGIGFWEVLLILVVALIIWGPNRLPEIARTLGKTVRGLKKASLDFTNAISREIDRENEKSAPPENPRKQVPDSSANTEKGKSPPKEEDAERRQS